MTCTPRSTGVRLALEVERRSTRPPGGRHAVHRMSYRIVVGVDGSPSTWTTAMRACPMRVPEMSPNRRQQPAIATSSNL